MRANANTCLAALAAAVTGLLTAADAGARDISRGEILSMSCFACHGTDGRSASDIPPIYGIPADVLYHRLKAFKEGKTLSTVMGRHAAGYSDADLRAIADYLAGLRRR
ncbi:MAG TPA: c-type cytochrome [Chromatiales bacterium]|nr:c-type cytochrome [Chromatiales bacterium]